MALINKEVKQKSFQLWLYLMSYIPEKHQHSLQKAEDLSLSKHVTPSG